MSQSGVFALNGRVPLPALYLSILFDCEMLLKLSRLSPSQALDHNTACVIELLALTLKHKLPAAAD